MHKWCVKNAIWKWSTINIDYTMAEIYMNRYLLFKHEHHQQQHEKSEKEL